MKIDRFKKMANNKYRIYLEDGNFIDTYDEVIINNNLLYKKELDDDLTSKIVDDNKYFNSYNKCIKMLSTKLKSTYSIRKYLEKELEDEDITKIIEKLTSIGLLDDIVYTKAYIKDKINFTNQGPNKIYNDLINEDINKNIILKEFKNIDKTIYEEKINRYIAKKLNTNKYSGYIFKQKVLTELINMGYDKEMILEILSSYDIKDNIDREFNKIYSKLSKKYSGMDLIRNIKNKLYKKGYSKESIDEALKKVDI